MTGSATDTDSTGLAPDDAFDLLGNDTRMTILQTLSEADGPLSFSDLRDRVGVRDSGNFNYHLDKFMGYFVEKTDDAYQLTGTGQDIVRMVLAGTVTADPSFGYTAVDACCPLCDEPVGLTYGDNVITCSCTACEGIFPTHDESGTLFWFAFPPAGVEDRTPEEVFHATITHTFHRIAAFRAGVCPTCSGRVEFSVDVCRTHDTGLGDRCPECDRPHMAEVVDICRVCEDRVFGPVRIAMLVHPTVTAFYHDHGIEHRFASWDTYCRSHEVRETLVSAEPLELRLAIPAENEELHLTVDDDLDVIDATRVTG